ncbi:cytochrome c biogenesis protein CcsA [uncultured Campylobacter sp.]|uniref:cytochrome c biogenesis protein CcsA n=1 Tax=uncultured Campylobacter sp. TaxID=218934 RepID=UPI0026371BC4|nr:cytochrome c biogenesis protein CcsA [uncultured Campylobacter sp.]
MKNAFYNFGSLLISVVLFLIFAFACAIATFIESAYGTPTAWAMVYSTLWFGFIQLLLGINLVCAIFRYKMINKNKIPMLLFHISFLFILLGSIFTRYMGFEGILHIRENEENSLIESSKSFIKFSTLKDGEVYGKYIQKDIALLPFVNNFNINLDLDADEAVLRYKNLLLDAKEVFVEDENSSALLSMMLSLNGEARELIFSKGEVKNIAGVNFYFMSDEKPVSPYVLVDENLKLSSDKNIKFLSMASGENSVLKAGDFADTSEKRLYDFGVLNFVIKYASKNARIDLKGSNRLQDESFLHWLKSISLESFRTILVSLFGEPQKWQNSSLSFLKDFAMSKDYQALRLGNNAVNALELELEYKGEKSTFYVLEYSGAKRVNVAGQSFFISWGKHIHDLGFSLYLKDFILERYSGSMSPKSYESLVEIRDGDFKQEARIFMNNVLDYKGYRFFQSSYDQDEKGTILSVNQDPGKLTTYIGYTLLFLGMFLNLLNPKSRFRQLASLVSKDSLKNSAPLILICILFFSTNVKAQDLPNISKEHSDKLAALVLQKLNGRMSPFDTISKEILEKLYKDTSYKGMDSNAVVLSMLMNSKAWSEEDIIIMPRNKAVREEIAKILSIEPADYISFADFFDEKGQYKLAKYAENSNRKAPNARGVFDKEIIKLDERANIVNLAFLGELFRFLPKQNDSNNAWLTSYEVLTKLSGEEKEVAVVLLDNYFTSVKNALQSGDWNDANKALDNISAYQKKFSAQIMPSEGKIYGEIFMNESKPFVKLTPIYLLAGLLLLILIIAKMLKPKLNISLIFKIVYAINVIAFILHSAGLAMRAYIAEHAPWSNAYESMVYIAWALALSGIFFSRKSPIALALTSILSGIVLQVAHLSEMDPQITNLMPVLDSYWLVIHVSVITASYGFLGLCALLGIFVLCLFCFMKKDSKHNENIARNILEATRINEMAMILGLCLLTVGNFLGAIWANESWGRYWSWDSKETWSLVSILVYASILHIRMIPSLSNQYNFALCSMFGYWSIIMTYFGVNYFLVGMHSYAAGEAVQIPSYVYYGFLLMIVLALFSYRKKSFAKRL